MSGRIRSIKPETLDDEVAVALSDAAWRMWISLRCVADDHGNTRAGDRYLAATVWQDTSRDVTEARDELVSVGKVKPYAVHGQRYFHLEGWEREQRIDNAGKPRVPGPESDDGTWNQAPTPSLAETRGNPPRLAASLGGSPLDLRSLISDLRPTISDQRPPIAAAIAAPNGSVEPSSVCAIGHHGVDQEPASRAAVRETPQGLAEPAAGLPVPVDAGVQPTLPLPQAAKSDGSDVEDASARAIRTVFEHWVAGWKRFVGGGRAPRLDDKRRGRIRARMREQFSVEDLKRAVDGMWATPWNLENKFYDIELVCRDSAHVERFMANAPMSEPAEDPVPAKDYGPPADPTPEQAEILKRILAPPRPATALLAEVQAADVGADIRWEPKPRAGGSS